MAESKHQSLELRLPADKEYALVARMALSGFGMLVDLDVDLIDDLRTVTDECIDCLLHQPLRLKELRVVATLAKGRLKCAFCSVRGEDRNHETAQDQDITRSILETLMPDVRLNCDENGVCCIEFSMPV